VGEKLTESITLKLPVQQLTQELIDGLDLLFQTHKGGHKLRMELIDTDQRLKVGMASTDRKVHVDNAFARELNRLGIEFSLN
ncbi:MAG: hypothetical protein ACKOAY_09520, partial [Haliscomenobacter sp.]